MHVFGAALPEGAQNYLTMAKPDRRRAPVNRSSARFGKLLKKKLGDLDLR